MPPIRLASATSLTSGRPREIRHHPSTQETNCCTNRILCEASTLLNVRVQALPKSVAPSEAGLLPGDSWSDLDWTARRLDLGGPDATSGVEAAQRMLRAVAAQGYLAVTYWRLPDQYLLSLH